MNKLSLIPDGEECVPRRRAAATGRRMQLLSQPTGAAAAPPDGRRSAPALGTLDGLFGDANVRPSPVASSAADGGATAAGSKKSRARTRAASEHASVLPGSAADALNWRRFSGRKGASAKRSRVAPVAEGAVSFRAHSACDAIDMEEKDDDDEDISMLAETQSQSSIAPVSLFPPASGSRLGGGSGESSQLSNWPHASRLRLANSYSDSGVESEGGRPGHARAEGTGWGAAAATAAAPTEISAAAAVAAVGDADKDRGGIGGVTLPIVERSVCSPNEDLDAITADTLLAMMRAAAGSGTRFRILDCRFPYEFEGGHIRGAINTPDPLIMAKVLFAGSDAPLYPEQLLAGRTNAGARVPGAAPSPSSSSSAYAESGPHASIYHVDVDEASFPSSSTSNNSNSTYYADGASASFPPRPADPTAAASTRGSGHLEATQQHLKPALQMEAAEWDHDREGQCVTQPTPPQQVLLRTRSEQPGQPHRIGTVGNASAAAAAGDDAAASPCASLLESWTGIVSSSCSVQQHNDGATACAACSASTLSNTATTAAAPAAGAASTLTSSLSVSPASSQDAMSPAATPSPMPSAVPSLPQTGASAPAAVTAGAGARGLVVCPSPSPTLTELSGLERLGLATDRSSLSSSAQFSMVTGRTMTIGGGGCGSGGFSTLPSVGFSFGLHDRASFSSSSSSCAAAESSPSSSAVVKSVGAAGVLSAAPLSSAGVWPHTAPLPFDAAGAVGVPLSFSTAAEVVGTGAATAVQENLQSQQQQQQQQQQQTQPVEFWGRRHTRKLRSFVSDTAAGSSSNESNTSSSSWGMGEDTPAFAASSLIPGLLICTDAAVASSAPLPVAYGALQHQPHLLQQRPSSPSRATTTTTTTETTTTRIESPTPLHPHYSMRSNTNPGSIMTHTQQHGPGAASGRGSNSALFVPSSSAFSPHRSVISTSSTSSDSPSHSVVHSSSLQQQQQQTVGTQLIPSKAVSQPLPASESSRGGWPAGAPAAAAGATMSGSGSGTAAAAGATMGGSGSGTSSAAASPSSASHHLPPHTVLIFHCEFSHQRGPKMMRSVREYDRLSYLNGAGRTAPSSAAAISASAMEMSPAHSRRSGYDPRSTAPATAAGGTAMELTPAHATSKHATSAYYEYACSAAAGLGDASSSSKPPLPPSTFGHRLQYPEMYLLHGGYMGLLRHLSEHDVFPGSVLEPRREHDAPQLRPQLPVPMRRHQQQQQHTMITTVTSASTAQCGTTTASSSSTSVFHAASFALPMTPAPPTAFDTAAAAAAAVPSSIPLCSRSYNSGSCDTLDDDNCVARDADDDVDDGPPAATSTATAVESCSSINSSGQAGGGLTHPALITSVRAPYSRCLVGSSSGGGGLSGGFDTAADAAVRRLNSTAAYSTSSNGTRSRAPLDSASITRWLSRFGPDTPISNSIGSNSSDSSANTGCVPLAITSAHARVVSFSDDVEAAATAVVAGAVGPRLWGKTDSSGSSSIGGGSFSLSQGKRQQHLLQHQRPLVLSSSSSGALSDADTTDNRYYLPMLCPARKKDMNKAKEDIGLKYDKFRALIRKGQIYARHILCGPASAQRGAGASIDGSSGNCGYPGGGGGRGMSIRDSSAPLSLLHLPLSTSSSTGIGSGGTGAGVALSRRRVHVSSRSFDGLIQTNNNKHPTMRGHQQQLQQQQQQQRQSNEIDMNVDGDCGNTAPALFSAALPLPHLDARSVGVEGSDEGGEMESSYGSVEMMAMLATATPADAAAAAASEAAAGTGVASTVGSSESASSVPPQDQHAVAAAAAEAAVLGRSSVAGGSGLGPRRALWVHRENSVPANPLMLWVQRDYTGAAPIAAAAAGAEAAAASTSTHPFAYSPQLELTDSPPGSSTAFAQQYEGQGLQRIQRPPLLSRGALARSVSAPAHDWRLSGSSSGGGAGPAGLQQGQTSLLQRMQQQQQSLLLQSPQSPLQPLNDANCNSVRVDDDDAYCVRAAGARLQLIGNVESSSSAVFSSSGVLASERSQHPRWQSCGGDPLAMGPIPQQAFSSSLVFATSTSFGGGGGAYHGLAPASAATLPSLPVLPGSSALPILPSRSTTAAAVFSVGAAAAVFWDGGVLPSPPSASPHAHAVAIGGQHHQLQSDGGYHVTDLLSVQLAVASPSNATTSASSIPTRARAKPRLLRSDAGGRGNY